MVANQISFLWLKTRFVSKWQLGPAKRLLGQIDCTFFNGCGFLSRCYSNMCSPGPGISVFNNASAKLQYLNTQLDQPTYGLATGDSLERRRALRTLLGR